jgi:hypothetical protein
MQRLEIETHYVRIVTTHRGGATTENDIRFNSQHAAIEACDKLQAEIDEDAEPKRCFVLDASMVPIHAGGERRSSPNRSQQRRPA